LAAFVFQTDCGVSFTYFVSRPIRSKVLDDRRYIGGAITTRRRAHSAVTLSTVQMLAGSNAIVVNVSNDALAAVPEESHDTDTLITEPEMDLEKFTGCNKENACPYTWCSSFCEDSISTQDYD
jgi:hypothetical protein